MERAISMEIGILLIIRGFPLIQVYYMGNNSPSGELEFGDIESWKADSEIGNYLVNCSVANEYRDAERSGGLRSFGEVRDIEFDRGEAVL